MKLTVIAGRINTSPRSSRACSAASRGSRARVSRAWAGNFPAAHDLIALIAVRGELTLLADLELAKRA